MRPYNSFFLMIALLVGVFNFSLATELALRLTDQDGNLIPASLFGVNGSTIQQEEVIVLDEGTYNISIIPGINGIEQASIYLFRTATVMVSGDSQIETFSWNTVEWELHLVDQNGDDIPESSIEDTHFGFYEGYNGMTVTLPVSEDPSNPNIQGTYATGYKFRLWPGVNGVENTYLLYRDDAVEVEPSPVFLVKNFVWNTVEWELHLVDQYGDDIPQSTIQEPHSGFYDGFNGLTVILPVTEDPNHPNLMGTYATGYKFRLRPGVNGVENTSYLRRDDVVEVGLSPTFVVKNFIWNTVEWELHLVDQYGDDIPQSTIQEPHGGFYYGFNGVTATLPVTEDVDHPNLSGTYADGYKFRLRPGVNGVENTSYLRRDDVVEVEASPTFVVKNFIWNTVEWELHLKDQHGNDIPNSTIREPHAGFYNGYNGLTATLPVTEDPAHPYLMGTYANGYKFWLRPGVNGVENISYLSRVDTVEVEASPLLLIKNFIWETTSGSLHVVDDSEQEICASEILNGLLGYIPTNSFVQLPVTEDPNQSGIMGTYKDGYYIRIKPGLNESFSETFFMPLHTGGVFDPQFVDINNEEYGLRFNLDECDQCDGCTTPASICALMNQQVNDLHDEGVLNQGQANSLTAKINNACNSISNGNINAAVNQLNAFINQVQALINAGVLTPEQGQALIDSANALITLIQQSSSAPLMPVEWPKVNQYDPGLACYPNPFMDRAQIYFTLAEASDTELSIYSLAGEKLVTLLDGYFEPGRYTVEWNSGEMSGAQFSHGVYLCHLTTGKKACVIKLVKQ